MRLVGKLVKETRVIKEAVVERDEENISFRDALEECFINLCKELDIQVPLWLKNNTSEFAVSRKTFFSKEHFIENVNFDTFVMRMI